MLTLKHYAWRSIVKTIFVLFDSLCRNALGCYGPRWVKTPNFDRFARRAVTFDNHYVGSLPCMPARRDLHTGRLNFMHRSWGPLEPFDNSFPEQMRDAGIHTHLVTDHMHYFEDGGATYHGRFRTWDFIRGQEYDPWKAMVEPPLERLREKYAAKHYRLRRPAGSGCSTRSTASSCRRSRTSACRAASTRRSSSSTSTTGADNWFLMLECFDPHEPFQAPEALQGAVRAPAGTAASSTGRSTRRCTTPEEIAEIRANYAALVARLRPLLRQAARLFRPARPVEGHRAGPVHRPRLPARRARLVGQEPDALLHRDRAHPADRPSPAHAAARPASGAAR